MSVIVGRGCSVRRKKSHLVLSAKNCAVFNFHPSDPSSVSQNLHSHQNFGGGERGIASGGGIESRTRRPMSVVRRDVLSNAKKSHLFSLAKNCAVFQIGVAFRIGHSRTPSGGGDDLNRAARDGRHSE